MSTLTLEQRHDREEQIKAMLVKGMSHGQIAVEIGISPQSVQKFLSRRGWKTKFTQDREKKLEGQGE